MVDILLGTYQGAKYLEAQIDSILAQTITGWTLYIHDDGSTDGTPDIVAAYAQRHPGRIVVLPDLPHGPGAAGNFMALLSKSQGRYAMFCDQDDCWHPDKIAVTLREMEGGEAAYGHGCPLLVHTDLALVNREGEPIAPSFFQYRHLSKKANTLNKLLCQNNVTGCTVMVNAPLRALLCERAPERVAMHDWWAAITAAAFGHVLYVDRATIDYRQHGGNQVGARQARPGQRAAEALEDSGATRRSMEVTYRQARDFLACYGDILPEGQEACVRRYADLPAKGKLCRMAAILRHGYTKQSIPWLLGQLIFC